MLEENIDLIKSDRPTATNIIQQGVQTDPQYVASNHVGLYWTSILNDVEENIDPFKSALTSSNREFS